MTGERTLRGCHILVVEDEYFIAEQLQLELEDEGAIVLGPVASVDEALAAIGSGEPIDGAVLDVNLQGEPIFPAAELLLRRNVPVIFTTGYDAGAIPAALQHVARCEKPSSLRSIVAAVGRAVHA